MPKILSRQPRWLDYGTPGFNLFQPNKKHQEEELSDGERGTPSKRIAHRGTEVFVAVGNELRWSDLNLLKENYENQAEQRDSGVERSYMVSCTVRCLKRYTDITIYRCLEHPLLDRSNSCLSRYLAT